ncbi:enoyl-CoA hydratase/isomerase domain-containing protein [Trichoderma breve]|uniref:Enoyl-CoA hydratase/isomerase domain-containing protein n=1 Tax=Trichoderma breve TaxID=2034170 RepID=A0A9W9E9V4_9HYPO|nr:enoyl-CoA hydratase/isomerase domain-containing protein [Trichoderma breve]KAJ4862672.1 enoyl-CoA hydratase/isomerase domain-containing protein [Trichoderma breve]
MEKSFLVPCPPFELQLSHLDRTFPPTHSKRILCFSLSPDVDRQRVVDYLYIAFHHTVQRVPFLAGSIVPFSEEEGGRPWLRNLIPQGNARLEIKDLSSELSFAELEKSNFSQNLLDTEKLCPLPDVAYVSEEPVPVCAFQANFIEGGLLLVVSIVHIAADGRGVTQVINIFANQLVKAQSGELGFPLKQREDIYQSDRTVLVTGNGAQGAIENHAAWTSEPMSAHLQIRDVETSCRTFRISAKALVELKRVASAPSRGPDAWISTNDAITGFIWRSIMLARQRAGILADGATTHLAQPIDCRTLLRLPDPYFGNVLYVTKTSTPLAVIADDQRGIAEASFMVRAELNSMTGEKFRDLLAYAERTEKEFHTRGNIIEDLATGGLMITSHFKFGLHEMDFGPIFGDGHMKALRLPATGTVCGVIIVMPRLDDGSCEFLITEEPKTIQCLLEDDVFTRFTREGDATIPAAIAQPNNTKIPSTLCVSNVDASHVGTIRIIQLYRPETKNAISRQMLQELSQQIEEIHSEKSASGTRALILASAVDNVFCAGADLKERKKMSVSETQQFLVALRDMFSRLAALPIPTIACVSGLALGGGLELALCCHLRVFSSNARVGLPETRLAIIPGAGGTYRLSKIVGSSNALDLVLTGRHLEASEAASMGLCHRLVTVDAEGTGQSPDKQRALSIETGIALAQEICMGGPVAVRAAVSALAVPGEATENAAYDSVLETKDRIEALQAYSEKRKPIFTGE